MKIESAIGEQLELFELPGDRIHITVSVAFELLWKGHLETKPSSATYRYNRIAMTKSFGEVPFSQLTEIHVAKHIDARRRGLMGFRPCGGQTLRHDLQLLTLTYNKLLKWKRKAVRVGVVDCSTIELPLQNPIGDIERPRGQRREYIVSPDEWARFSEHASSAMMRRAYFALDTGLGECDLRALKTAQYDPVRDCIRVIRRKNRHKIQKAVWVPITKRCRKVIFEAIKQNREFVLDWTNHINELRQVKSAAKSKFQWRDLRKTFGNHVLSTTKEITKMQRALMHASPRTTWDWYVIDDGKDLRPSIMSIEDRFPSHS